MIEQIRKNIDTEIEILKEIYHYQSLLRNANPSDRKILVSTIQSLTSSIKIINNSLPELLKEVTSVQKLTSKASTMPLQNIQYFKDENKIDVVLKEEDKEKFLQELRITEDAVRKMKKSSIIQPTEEIENVQKSSRYVKISNAFFKSQSEKLIQKGYFKPLALDVRKANFEMLLESYVSMMLFTVFLSLIAGLVLFLGLWIYGISPSKIFWIPLILPLGTFAYVYVYPTTEKDSIAKRIDQELPFAVIHMSAISGAGIEPTNIFKIIALSREYPYLRKEIRKILNQLNIYGYDLVTALTHVARVTPSTNLSELLTGLSTTINSGGSLSEFFEKRAETLLNNYRLEREKFTKTAETFMDIYITIAIAAPMIMLLMLIMLSLSNFDFGLDQTTLTVLVIAIIALINVFFLTMLHMKQPKY